MGGAGAGARRRRAHGRRDAGGPSGGAALAEAGLQPGSGPARRRGRGPAGATAPTGRADATRAATGRAPPLTPTVGRAGELARALQALERRPAGHDRRSGRRRQDPPRRRRRRRPRRCPRQGCGAGRAGAGHRRRRRGVDDRRRPRPPTDRRARSVAALADLGALDALVVLDNCEHVVDAVVPIVPRLLADGDQPARRWRRAASRWPSTASTSSRSARWPTDGTGRSGRPAVPPAGRGGRCPAGDGSTTTLRRASVVARLDGLPLALEMAAARLRTMTLAELAVVDRRRPRRPGHATSRRRRAPPHAARACWRGPSACSTTSSAPPCTTSRCSPGRCAAVTCPPRSAPPGPPTRSPGSSTGRWCWPLPSRRRRSLRRARDGPQLRPGAAAGGGARRRGAAPARRVVLDAGRRARRRTCAPRTRRRRLIRFGDIVDELRAAVRWSHATRTWTIAAELVCRSYLPAAPCCAPRSCRGRPTSPSACCRTATRDRDRVRSVLAGGPVVDGSARRRGRASARRCSPGRRATPVALQALEGLADAAIYQGRLADAVRLLDGVAGAGEAARATPTTSTWPASASPSPSPTAATSTGRWPTVADGPAVPVAVGGGLVRVHPRGDRPSTAIPSGALDHLDRAVELATLGVGDRYVTEVALLSSSSLRARTGDLAAAVDRFTELLDHFGAGGDPGHLVTSLRNLVTLLVRLGQYRPAAALYGAVVDHPSSPTYGAEAAAAGGGGRGVPRRARRQGVRPGRRARARRAPSMPPSTPRRRRCGLPAPASPPGAGSAPG